MTRRGNEARRARERLLAAHGREAIDGLARDHVAVIATGAFAAALGHDAPTATVRRMRRADACRILTPAVPPSFGARFRSELAFPATDGSATVVVLDASAGPCIVHVREP